MAVEVHIVTCVKILIFEMFSQDAFVREALKLGAQHALVNSPDVLLLEFVEHILEFFYVYISSVLDQHQFQLGVFLFHAFVADEVKQQSHENRVHDQRIEVV
jgi:hypothetical protein